MSSLSQRHLDIVLTLGEVELAFLSEPTQGAMHFVNFELSGFAQILEAHSLLRIVQGVPHETCPVTNVFSVNKKNL